MPINELSDPRKAADEAAVTDRRGKRSGSDELSEIELEVEDVELMPPGPGTRQHGMRTSAPPPPPAAAMRGSASSPPSLLESERPRRRRHSTLRGHQASDVPERDQAPAANDPRRDARGAHASDFARLETHAADDRPSQTAPADATPRTTTILPPPSAAAHAVARLAPSAPPLQRSAAPRSPFGDPSARQYPSREPTQRTATPSSYIASREPTQRSRLSARSPSSAPTERPAPPLEALARDVPLDDLVPGNDAPAAPASVPATLHLSVQRDLESARAELSRLNRVMRARDAYLLELERALEQNAQLLRRLGLAGADGAAELHGRLRGQTFRIAELETELERRDAPEQLEPERNTEVRPRPAAAG